MTKNEFAIGETFQFGLKKLKAAKVKEGKHGCVGCYLYDQDIFDCYDIIGNCSHENRTDSTDVIFIKVENEG